MLKCGGAAGDTDDAVWIKTSIYCTFTCPSESSSAKTQYSTHYGQLLKTFGHHILFNNKYCLQSRKSYSFCLFHVQKVSQWKNLTKSESFGHRSIISTTYRPHWFHRHKQAFCGHSYCVSWVGCNILLHFSPVSLFAHEIN